MEQYNAQMPAQLGAFGSAQGRQGRGPPGLAWACPADNAARPQLAFCEVTGQCRIHVERAQTNAAA
eukprot:11155187-Lingulodinium_polyedra.AAC.1